MLAILILLGCNSPKSSNIETNKSLHNCDNEMLVIALKKHSEFPKLNPNETVTIESINETVIYSSQIEYIPSKTVNNENTEVEASSAQYFITLIKESEGDKVKSYWKYQYFPLTNKIILIESEGDSLE
ncbi:hypothetical protein [Bacillus ndiopicus]|uniref:hypothetical protein n=1 Tax=Bacillus ndiopicus TaxID=1347368 RepID=UPI0005AA874C|nr:hypothetical protein [Bacillus ndiopicus]